MINDKEDPVNYELVLTDPITSIHDERNENIFQVHMHLVAIIGLFTSFIFCIILGWLNIYICSQHHSSIYWSRNQNPSYDPHTIIGWLKKYYSKFNILINYKMMELFIHLYFQKMIFWVNRNKWSFVKDVMMHIEQINYCI